MSSNEELAKDLRNELIHRLDMSRLEDRRVWVLIELASFGYDKVIDELLVAASGYFAKSRGN